MSLPALIDYTAPLDEQVRNRAAWTLEPGRSAVLVHDLQRYFIRSFAPGCPALEVALASTARILTAARAVGVPVFYTAQTGDQPAAERGLQGELWGRGMTSSPEDTDIVEEVRPRSGDVVLTKHRYSAFTRSDLADRLAALGRDQLVITGVYAHIGVCVTAADAFQREIYPFVVADAVADFGADEHRRALAQVASCSGMVTDSAGVLAALSSGSGEQEVTGHRGWEQTVLLALAELMPGEAVATAVAEPDTDLFELGLDSIRAFELLDRLLEAGVDIDFGELTRRPTLSYLHEQASLERTR